MGQYPCDAQMLSGECGGCKSHFSAGRRF